MGVKGVLKGEEGLSELLIGIPINWTIRSMLYSRATSVLMAVMIQLPSTESKVT